MSKAIQCDRCKGFQDEEDISSKIARVNVLRNLFFPNGVRRWGNSRWGVLDLCLECSRDLDRFLDNEQLAKGLES